MSFLELQHRETCNLNKQTNKMRLDQWLDPGVPSREATTEPVILLSSIHSKGAQLGSSRRRIIFSGRCSDEPLVSTMSSMDRAKFFVAIQCQKLQLRKGNSEMLRFNNMQRRRKTYIHIIE